MVDDYIYKLSKGITLKISDNIGPINEWEVMEGRDKLIVGKGFVETEDSGIVCTSAPLSNSIPVVSLFGASWDSEENDTGDAKIHAGRGTSSKQSWELISVS